MRALVQRVGRARVLVAGETVGEIGRGLCALVGVANGDDAESARRLAARRRRHERNGSEPAGRRAEAGPSGPAP